MFELESAESTRRILRYRFRFACFWHLIFLDILFLTLFLLRSVTVAFLKKGVYSLLAIHGYQPESYQEGLEKIKDGGWRENITWQLVRELLDPSFA